LNFKPEKRKELEKEAEALGMESRVLDYMVDGYEEIYKFKLLIKIPNRIAKIKILNKWPNIPEELKVCGVKLGKGNMYIF
jgi:hypothetical protein